MKTCSDSLKALLHQYRTGEKRTWYIADLYTVWLKNVEKTTMSWSYDIDGEPIFTEGRFGQGLYRPASSNTNSTIKIACPPADVFDFTISDWTVEFFYKVNGVSGSHESGTNSVADLFVIGDSTYSYDSFPLHFYGLYLRAWKGRGDYYEDGYYDIRTEFQFGYYDADLDRWEPNGFGQSYDYVQDIGWHHIVLQKEGNVIHLAWDGKYCGFGKMHNEGDTMLLPANGYIHLLAPKANSSFTIDEVRISTCCRYEFPQYDSTYTVPTAPFTPDEYTLSLLHLDGNLDDEGFMASVPPTTKDFGGGEILLYTGHDTDLTCGGNKYRHIAIEHGDIEESRGTETATMDLTINYNPSDTITPNDERTWFRALKDCVFDKAYVSLDRLYSPIPWQYNMPNISIDYVLKSRFFGRMDVQEVKLDHASIQVKSPTDMLSRELPRNLVKPSCLNHFGDFMCQYDPEKFRKTVTAQTGSNQSKIVIGQTFTQGDYNNGLICCTGGKNKGQFSTIRTYVNGEVILFKPFVEEVQVGDTFDMLCGCDKTLRMCRDVYGNLEHFRGCPFLPCKNVLM
jgi:uncharacterized phage protein (TIGR02218 family)